MVLISAAALYTLSSKAHNPVIWIFRDSYVNFRISPFQRKLHHTCNAKLYSSLFIIDLGQKHRIASYHAYTQM